MMLLSVYIGVGALVTFIKYLYRPKDAVTGNQWYDYVVAGLIWPATLIVWLMYAGSTKSNGNKS